MKTKVSQHFAVLFIFIATVGRCLKCPDGESPVKEINYQLKGENLHSRQTGHHGDSLIIGLQPEKSSGKVTDIYRCSRVNIKYYKKQYEIKVQKKSSTSYKVEPAEKYFIYYVKEVWQCEDSNRKLPDFKRIVNEVMSTNEILEVKFYDGVEVGTRNYKSADHFNTVIKEIKYVNTNMEFIKFEGSLCLLKNNNNFHSIPNLIEQHYQYEVPPPNAEGYFKDHETHYIQVEQTHIHISDAGRSLKIGTRVTKSDSAAEYRKGNHICHREGDVSQYSPIFSPKIQQKVKSEPEVFADVKDNDFFKYFTVVRKEIYMCIKTFKDMYGKTQKQRYFRVVDDVIGLIPIKDIYYLGGIVSLSAISVPNGVSVRFKEIRYKAISGSTLFLVDPLSSWPDCYLENVKFDEDLLHSTLTMDRSIDMAYLLTPMSVFRTLIGSEGFDLRVGATYTDQIGDETSSFNSNEVKYMDAFDTVVKVKMNDNFIYSVVPIEKESSFYKVISTEILECSNTEINFLRILNKIEVLEPVHEIETYDGVEIVGTVLDNGSKSVRIFEKKYLNSTSYRPIKYVGKITFQTSDNAQATLEARKFAISKTVDDADRSFGYTATFIPTMRDNNTPSKYANIHSNVLVIGKGNTLQINKIDWRKSTGSRCNDDEKAMCVKYEEDVKKMERVKANIGVFPNFQVLDEKNKMIQSFDKGDIDSLYFTTEVNEVFLCTIENKESNINKFLRVVTSKKLKKVTPYLIGGISQFQEGTVSVEVENDELEVTYQEIRYFKYPSLKILKYTGYKAVQDNIQPRPPKPLKSGSESISNTKYEDILLSCHQDQELTTNWDTHTQFNTRIVPREVDNDNILVEVDSIFGTYFENLNREVWTCTDENLKNNIMLRVVNQFKVKPGRMNAIKELYYYDGLSIVLGKIGSKACLEIIEVKYLDPEDLKVLKYEGDVELSGVAVSNSITTMRPSRLQSPAKRDFHYTLGENELRKTELYNNGDIILEIGQKVVEHVKTNNERLICQTHQSDESTSMLMRPKIVMYKFSGSGFLPMKIMDEKIFSDYFELKTRFWKCEGKGLPQIYRVENLLKTNCKKSTGCNEKQDKISRVYHRDGITIISKDENTLAVEEIKYVSDLTKDYKLLEFDGFMTFEDSVRTASSELKTPLKVKEMNNYLMDCEIVNVAGPYGCRLFDEFDECRSTDVGVVFEVVSHRSKEIEVTDHVVTCERIENAKYRKEFGMKVNVYLNLKVADGKNEWSRQVVDIRESENFEGIAQNTWMCKRDREQIFYIVKNYMVVKQELARVYHSDVVSVNWLVLPDTSKNVEIEEVKLIDPETLEVFKYDGELKLMSKARQSVMQTFFPFDCEGESLTAGREAVNYWSLNAMRFFASRRGTVDNIDQKQHPYFKKNSSPLNMNFGRVTLGGSRVVRVGTRCTEEYKPTVTPKCMLHEWNKEYRSKYIPKVVEFYYDKWYEFDEETFHFFFDITEQVLWFCVANEEELIFRIITTFRLLPQKTVVGDIGYFTFHEGVELLPRNDTEIYFQETVFVDPMNNKHFKYAGDLRFIRNTKTLVPKSMVGVAGFYAMEYSKFAGRKAVPVLKTTRDIVKGAGYGLAALLLPIGHAR